jgi:hypothetical protein
MISLLIVLVISSAIIVYTFTMGSDSVSFGDAIHVTSEEELRVTVNDAENGKPVTIVFDKSISLTDSPLIIPANKNITLTSKNSTRFYKLNGVDWCTTIIVEDCGMLRLDGIAVTHAIGDFGCGVQVATGGTLIMYSGEISGNAAFSNGGGVYNELYCNFNMSGGAVSNNTSVAPGGGVYNRGTFSMSGGIISNNTADIGYSGGVYNSGNFNRSGGEISDNITGSDNNTYAKK